MNELSYIESQRRTICGNCSCNINFSDPNSSCPKGFWGGVFFDVNSNGKSGHYFFKRQCPSDGDCFQENSNSTINQKYPKPLEMVKSFAGSVANEIKATLSGVDSVSEEEKNKRLKICNECDFFDNSQKRCTKCGCFLLIKAAWRSQTCPIGKW